jgi:KUP system potassium uptake protein
MADHGTSVLEPRARATPFRLGLALAALGVVYGDIGTSPLYTLGACLSAYSLQPTPDNVNGILSSILWTILIVVTLKYVWLVMRADNHGEGGILALLTLAQRTSRLSPQGNWGLAMVGIVGAALFLGDSMITPAISVLSAIEGLEVATATI